MTHAHLYRVLIITRVLPYITRSLLYITHILPYITRISIKQTQVHATHFAPILPPPNSPTRDSAYLLIQEPGPPPAIEIIAANRLAAPGVFAPGPSHLNFSLSLFQHNKPTPS